MNIQEYLKKHGLSQAEFAERIGVTPGMVNQWIKNIRPISPEMCVRIEFETISELTRKNLRPTDWESIWPELKDVA